MAAVEVTVTRSTARLAEARPPAMPLTIYTAGTAKIGTSSTRSRWRPKVHKQVLIQNSWIRPTRHKRLNLTDTAGAIQRQDVVAKTAVVVPKVHMQVLIKNT